MKYLSQVPLQPCVSFSRLFCAFVNTLLRRLGACNAIKYTFPTNFDCFIDSFFLLRTPLIQSPLLVWCTLSNRGPLSLIQNCALGRGVAPESVTLRGRENFITGQGFMEIMFTGLLLLPLSLAMTVAWNPVATLFVRIPEFKTICIQVELHRETKTPGDTLEPQYFLHG